MKAFPTLLTLGLAVLLAFPTGDARSRTCGHDGLSDFDAGRAETFTQPDELGCSSGIPAGTLTYRSGEVSPAPFRQELEILRDSMLANPACRVVVTGNGGGSKIEQQQSWDRVDALIAFMTDQYQISRDRFIFHSGEQGDASLVRYRTAADGEEGPSSLPPPFPNLRRD